MVWYRKGKEEDCAFLPPNLDSAPKTPPSRTCCLICGDDVGSFPWSQAPSSLRSFMVGCEYLSMALQMDASRQKPWTSMPWLKCCITVYLWALCWGGLLSCELRPSLGIHSGSGSLSLGFAGVCPGRGKCPGVKSCSCVKPLSSSSF